MILWFEAERQGRSVERIFCDYLNSVDILDFLALMHCIMTLTHRYNVARGAFKKSFLNFSNKEKSNIAFDIEVWFFKM